MSGRHRLPESRQHRPDVLYLAAIAAETALTALLGVVLLIGAFTPAAGNYTLGVAVLGGVALTLAFVRTRAHDVTTARRFLS